jgi:oligopeptide transport system ATP-binding protein
MKDIQDELKTTYLFIAHDLSMVKYISDRIGVMHLGHIVETGTTEEIFNNPIHPYTKSLLSAIPHPNPKVERERIAQEYDKDKEGVVYTQGHVFNLSDTHRVLATDEEFARWNKK